MKNNLIVTLSNSLYWSDAEKYKATKNLKNQFNEYKVYVLFTGNDNTIFQVLEYPRIINKLKNICIWFKYLLK